MSLVKLESHATTFMTTNVRALINVCSKIFLFNVVTKTIICVSFIYIYFLLFLAIVCVYNLITVSIDVRHKSCHSWSN